MIKSLLQFMQREDRNGTWLEWLKEIEKGESLFDAEYVISVLQSWYDDSNEPKYMNYIKQLK